MSGANLHQRVAIQIEFPDKLCPTKLNELSYYDETGRNYISWTGPWGYLRTNDATGNRIMMDLTTLKEAYSRASIWFPPEQLFSYPAPWWVSFIERRVAYLERTLSSISNVTPQLILAITHEMAWLVEWCAVLTDDYRIVDDFRARDPR